MTQQMVWLSGLLPYEQAALVFERIGHCHIPRMSIHRQAQEHGARLQAYQVRQAQQVAIERVIMPEQLAPLTRGVSMDGGMVNIRDEGWKEMKVGVVYDLSTAFVWDKELGEDVEVIHTHPRGCVGVLGNVEAFSPHLWRLAVDHEVPVAREVSITADGAEWIWNLSADLFPESTEIVDWYHACQHLAQAAQARHPDDPERLRRWYRAAQDTLFNGHITNLIDDFCAAHLDEHVRYFRVHQHRMQYREYREAGFAIGSGTIESSIKQLKSRLCGAGMRWSRPAAERMLVIRSAIDSNDFDHLWRAA